VLAFVLGIVLVIVAVVLWFGHLTPDHALAILIGIAGVLLAAWWAVPGRAWDHRG
jgi:hypothetical protein